MDWGRVRLLIELCTDGAYSCENSAVPVDDNNGNQRECEKERGGTSQRNRLIGRESVYGQDGNTSPTTTTMTWVTAMTVSAGVALYKTNGEREKEGGREGSAHGWRDGRWRGREHKSLQMGIGHGHGFARVGGEHNGKKCAWVVFYSVFKFYKSFRTLIK